MAEKIDPVRERERLAKRYGEMSDLELEQVGNDPEALTEWARAALQAEISHRGIVLADEAPSNGAEDPGNPVVLRVYRDMPAAFVDKSVLDAAGIRCFLQDANVVRMDWLWSNAMGGIKLVVSEAESEDAEKILSTRPLEPEGDAEEENS